MTFGFSNPLFLAGILTAALPVLMLLTRAATQRRVVFGSLYFLREAVRKASRSLEWKKWLLLICRILILTLLAVLFSIPFIQKQGLVDPSSRAGESVYILDTSYSMTWRSGGRSLWDEAVDRFLERAGDDLRERRLVSVYTWDQDVRAVLLRESGMDGLRKTVAGLSPVDRVSDYDALERFFDSRLSEIKSGRVRFHFLTDFAAGMHMGEEPSLPTGVHADRIKIPESPNLTIKDVILPPFPAVRGREYPLRIPVTCQSCDRQRGWKIEVKMDRKTVAEETVSFTGSGDSAVIETGFIPERDGRFVLEVRSGDDSLSADNSYYHLIHVRKPVRVLLIREPVYTGAFQEPYYYLEQAFSLQNVQGGGRPWIELIKKTSGEVQDVDLSGFDIVFASDIPAVTARLASRLRYFVKGGGILFFSPGPSVEPGEYGENSHLIRLLGGRFGGAVESSGTDYFVFRPVPWAHPLFRVFEEGRLGDFSSVRTERFFPFMTESGSALSASEVLLWFNDRWPALIEKTEGAGRVYIWTSSLGREWSEFPRHPLFVPFIYEWLAWTGLGQPPAPGWTGEDFTLDTPEGSKFRKAQLVTPGGSETFLYPGRDGLFTIRNPSQAGIYSWSYPEDESRKVYRSVLNARRGETGRVYALKSSVSENSVSAQPGTEEIESRLAPRKFYYAKPFTGMIFLLLLVEAFLANRFYGKEAVTV